MHPMRKRPPPKAALLQKLPNLLPLLLLALKVMRSNRRSADALSQKTMRTKHTLHPNPAHPRKRNPSHHHHLPPLHQLLPIASHQPTQPSLPALRGRYHVSLAAAPALPPSLIMLLLYVEIQTQTYKTDSIGSCCRTQTYAYFERKKEFDPKLLDRGVTKRRQIAPVHVHVHLRCCRPKKGSYSYS
jgi:hypothetical protein